MEESRLKPMVEGYNVELFNRIYDDTLPLRKKLASGIDPRRFGLAYEDILSFFDIKFIYVFNKYHYETEGVLKGMIINALSNFKNRILRSAYTNKHSQSIISTDNLLNLEDAEFEEPQSDKDYYYDKTMQFMKEHLSENAFLVLEVQLNPPPYILKRINVDKEKCLQKIPDDLLLEYFGLGFSDNAYKYLGQIKKEIRNAIAYAKKALRAS
jgi:hypothetical protein